MLLNNTSKVSPFRSFFYHPFATPKINIRFVNFFQQLVADISPSDVKGLGFDATCSMVALDVEGNPVAVNPGGRYGLIKMYRYHESALFSR